MASSGPQKTFEGKKIRKTCTYLFRNTLICSKGLELERDMYSFPGSEEHLWVGAGRGGVKHVLLQSCGTNVNHIFKLLTKLPRAQGTEKSESTKEIKPLTVRCFNT